MLQILTATTSAKQEKLELSWNGSAYRIFQHRIGLPLSTSTGSESSGKSIRLP